MTANELAVYLEDITDSEESPYRQAATMLRQQQAEIEALKAKMSLNNYDDGKNVAIQLTNEQIKQCAIKAGFQFNGNDLVFYDTGKQLLLKPNYIGTIVDGLKDFAKELLRKQVKND